MSDRAVLLRALGAGPEEFERFGCPLSLIKPEEDFVLHPCVPVDPLLRSGQDLFMGKRYREALEEFQDSSRFAEKMGDDLLRGHLCERQARVHLVTCSPECALRYAERSKALIRNYLGFSEDQMLRILTDPAGLDCPGLRRHQLSSASLERALCIYCMAAQTAFLSSVDLEIFCDGTEKPGLMRNCRASYEIASYLVGKSRSEFTAQLAVTLQAIALHWSVVKPSDQSPFQCLAAAKALLDRNGVFDPRLAVRSAIVLWRLERPQSARTQLLKASRRLTKRSDAASLAVSYCALSMITVQSDDWLGALPYSAAAAALHPHGYIPSIAMRQHEDAWHSGARVALEQSSHSELFDSVREVIAPIARAVGKHPDDLIRERLSWWRDHDPSAAMRLAPAA